MDRSLFWVIASGWRRVAMLKGKHIFTCRFVTRDTLDIIIDHALDGFLHSGVMILNEIG
jgi:hypothetical protein